MSSNLTSQKTGPLYPKTMSAANITTAQAAFSGTAPTERQIHQIIAARPGGNLEDHDWLNYVTSYTGGVPRGGF